MEIMRRVFIVTQKILVKLFLFLVYIIGFGLTLVFAAIFKRYLLEGSKKEDKTFWKQAKGYNPDMAECAEQS